MTDVETAIAAAGDSRSVFLVSVEEIKRAVEGRARTGRL
jgi:hypothetical protein